MRHSAEQFAASFIIRLGTRAHEVALTQVRDASAAGMPDATATWIEILRIVAQNEAEAHAGS